MKSLEQPTDTAPRRNFYDMFPVDWSASLDETNNLGQTPDTLPTAVESRERQGLQIVEHLGAETVKVSQDTPENL